MSPNPLDSQKSLLAFQYGSQNMDNGQSFDNNMKDAEFENGQMSNGNAILGSKVISPMSERVPAAHYAP